MLYHCFRKHKLPILFVCENNDKAIFTRVSDIHSFDIGLNVESYTIDFTSIEDGWKVSEVNRVATNLAERLRQGIGPQFMEVKTFRYMEHVGPNNDARDDSRTKEAFDAWYGKDPLSQHQVDSDLHRAVEKELAEALEFADRSPFPSADQLLVDVL